MYLYYNNVRFSEYYYTLLLIKGCGIVYRGLNASRDRDFFPPVIIPASSFFTVYGVYFESFKVCAMLLDIFSFVQTFF